MSTDQYLKHLKPNHPDIEEASDYLMDGYKHLNLKLSPEEYRLEWKYALAVLDQSRLRKNLFIKSYKQWVEGVIATLREPLLEVGEIGERKMWVILWLFRGQLELHYSSPEKRGKVFQIRDRVTQHNKFIKDTLKWKNLLPQRFSSQSSTIVEDLVEKEVIEHSKSLGLERFAAWRFIVGYREKSRSNLDVIHNKDTEEWMLNNMMYMINDLLIPHLIREKIFGIIANLLESFCLDKSFNRGDINVRSRFYSMKESFSD